MRKRIVIGLLAVVVIGVAAFFVSQPMEGTVEWYKRRFVSAQDKMFGRTWFTPVEKLFCKITGRPPRMVKLGNDEYQTLHSQMNGCRIGLVELGYMVERRFSVSNNPNVLLNNVWVNSAKVIPLRHARFTQISTSTNDGTNAVVITAVAEVLPKYGELVRKADGP